jgi:hypothetical protein
MPATAQRRSQLLSFLSDYLPHGTPQEYEDIAVAVLEAIRRDAARRVGEDQHMREVVVGFPEREPC